jgi:hypothetical protein
VSVEAISWALNLAPVPDDPSGKPNSACAFVLVGLANHAGPDGTAAFPAVSTLIRYTRLSERTVRTALDRLQAAGLITPCSSEIVAAHIRRADRRPQGWDLDLAQVRADLTSEEIATLERQFPGLKHRINEVQQLHPASQNGVRQLHPDGSASSNGVQLTHERGATDAERGAAVAPEPYIEPSIEPEPKNLSSSQPASLDGDGGEIAVAGLDEPGAREDVERICGHLADRVEQRYGKRPSIIKRWRTAARQMLEIDNLTEEQVHTAIDWCQDNEFWAPNVRSVPKLREKYIQLRAQAVREQRMLAGPGGGYRPSTTDQRVNQALDLAAEYREMELREGVTSGNGRAAIAGAVVTEQDAF